MPPILLDTVLLRSVTDNDLPALNAIYTDPMMRRFARPQHVEPLHRFHLLSIECRPPRLFVIEARTSGEIVGYCGLRPSATPLSVVYEPEIFLRGADQRKGIGREVLLALVWLGGKHEREFIARVHAQNFSSKQLLNSLGWSMTADGDWQDWTPPATE